MYKKHFIMKFDVEGKRLWYVVGNAVPPDHYHPFFHTRDDARAYVRGLLGEGPDKKPTVTMSGTAKVSELVRQHGRAAEAYMPRAIKIIKAVCIDGDMEKILWLAVDRNARHGFHTRAQARAYENSLVGEQPVQPVVTYYDATQDDNVVSVFGRVVRKIKRSSMPRIMFMGG